MHEPSLNYPGQTLSSSPNQFPSPLPSPGPSGNPFPSARINENENNEYNFDCDLHAGPFNNNLPKNKDDFLCDFEGNPYQFSFKAGLALQYIDTLRNATLDNEDLSEESIRQLCNPPQHLIDNELDSLTWPSLDLFLSLSNFSQSAYNEVCEALIHHNDEYSELLSYDRIKTLLVELTGVISITQDMCENSYHTFTEPLAHLDTCVCCGGPCYEMKDGKWVLVKQASFFPIGPQIQMQFHSPITAEKLCHWAVQMNEILKQLAKNDGQISILNNLYHGRQYLEAVLEGCIKHEDLILIFSIDGAQLYQSKHSSCTIYIWIITNLSPDIHYKKQHILIGRIIPSPKALKIMDFFIFSCLHHLAAIQKEGLKIWNALTYAIFTAYLHLLLMTADSIGITDMNGFVGHNSANGCRMGCDQCGCHKKQASTYYPAALWPHDHPNVPLNSRFPNINLLQDASLSTT